MSNTSFHDLQFDLAEERAETLHRDADHYRLVQEARRARSHRQRLGLWRRAISPRLAATARAVNDLLGAIISPPWPSDRAPMHPALRQSHGR